MAKAKTHFSCQACGHQSPKWLGKCPDCNAWGTLVEEPDVPDTGRASWGQSGGGKPVPLKQVETDAELRRATGIAELDRVLGGGVVAGSVVLLGGDPGIGKSTLLLQACHGLSLRGLKTLY